MEDLKSCETCGGGICKTCGGPTSATAIHKARAPIREVPASSQYSRDETERQTDSEYRESPKVSHEKDETNIATITPSKLEASVPGDSSASNSNQELEKFKEPIDPNIVDWDGPNDPNNPLNWPAWKVKTHIFLVSAITFIT